MSVSSGEFDRFVRWAVYQHFIETGRAPDAVALGHRTDADPADVEAALDRLASRRQLVLAPGTRNIWMAHPFSAVPTAYPVETARVTYWANCAWDALGIPAMLHADSRTRTLCADCGESLEIAVVGSSASSTAQCVHFGVGPRRFWDNIGFT